MGVASWHPLIFVLCPYVILFCLETFKMLKLNKEQTKNTKQC